MRSSCRPRCSIPKAARAATSAASWSARIPEARRAILRLSDPSASLPGAPRTGAPEKSRGCKNAEGVGEISEPRAQTADFPAEWRGAECLRPLSRWSGKRPDHGSSNLGLANALYCRSDPSCIWRDRDAAAGTTKPDQSMKSSTIRRRLRRRRLSASLSASSSSPSPSLPSSPCCPPSK